MTERGGERAHEQAAAVQGVRRPGHPRPGERQQHDRTDGGDFERDPRLASPRRTAEREPRRERGADEDRRDARVGAVVDARRVGRVVEVERPRQRRDRGSDRGEQHGDRRRPPRPHPHEHGDDQRPDQIELLLDREAPRVVERRRRAEDRPVVAAREDRAPVREIADRRERVAADRRELVGFREPAPRTARPRRGRTRARGAGVGPGAPRTHAQCDAAPLMRFGQQQRRDQEARQHEERVDTEEAAGEVPAVEQEYAGDRQAAEPVEGRLMGQPRVITRPRGRARLQCRMFPRCAHAPSMPVDDSTIPGGGSTPSLPYAFGPPQAVGPSVSGSAAGTSRRRPGRRRSAASTTPTGRAAWRARPAPGARPRARACR